jgi:hypothetical protein
MLKFNRSSFVALILIAGLSLTASQAYHSRSARSPAHYGPFVIDRSHIDNVTIPYRRKLEKPTMALDLATSAGGGLVLVDGVLTTDIAFTANIQAIDPATNAPQVDADGKPVLTPTDFAAGATLNPKVNAADNVLIPKDVTVTTQATANGDYSIGRFGYLGYAPRFKPENLEMYASKMGHSLRVKGWVTQDLVDTYEYALLSRFKSYSDMFGKTTIHLQPVKDISQLAANTKNSANKKWYTVASYYSKNLYDTALHEIYTPPASDDEYKQTVLTLMIRTFLNDPKQTVEGGLALYYKYQADPGFLATRAANSAALFRAHFKENYVEASAPAAPLFPIAPLVAPKPAPAVSGVPVAVETPTPPPAPAPHPGALGYLTFVYPIANDKDGPFKLPNPGMRKFPRPGTIEGRAYSTRWLDEFGGFPFLLITDDGVAFHGPITMDPAGDTWFLRRGNVSHSCMRMDPSDVMELRALLPKNIISLTAQKKTIPLWITEWPDVTDLDNNGTNQVVDVAYYTIPTSGTAISNPATYKPSLYNKTYWSTIFKPYMGARHNNLSPYLPRNTNATFTLNTSSVTDPATGLATTVNGAVLTGLPKYDVVNGDVQAIGFYTEPTPIRTFAQRPTQIIQFREDGLVYDESILNGDGADRWGSYPPGVVNKF